VRLDVLCGACQIRLVPGTVSFDPKSKTFGNCMVGALLVRALFRVFRFTLQGYKLIDYRPFTII
jgi:hypothetical protein